LTLESIAQWLEACSLVRTESSWLEGLLLIDHWLLASALDKVYPYFLLTHACKLV
jgi:hypothetical protein